MNTNGFTIIELTMSIVIIMILAAVLLPNIIGVRQKANDAAARTVANNTIQTMAAIESSDNILVTSCRSSRDLVEFTTPSGVSASHVNAPKPITSVSCVSGISSYQVSVNYTGGTANTFQLYAAK